MNQRFQILNALSMRAIGLIFLLNHHQFRSLLKMNRFSFAIFVPVFVVLLLARGLGVQAVTCYQCGPVQKGAAQDYCSDANFDPTQVARQTCSGTHCRTDNGLRFQDGRKLDTWSRSCSTERGLSDEAECRTDETGGGGSSLGSSVVCFCRGDLCNGAAAGLGTAAGWLLLSVMAAILFSL